MPDPEFQIIKAGAISNFPKGHPTPAEKSDALSCIGSLNYAQMWKAVSTLHSRKTVRLDAQKIFNDIAANLQVQINNVPPPSTIAQVLVHEALFKDFGTSDREKFKPAIRDHVVAALKKSIADGSTYKVLLAPMRDPEFTITATGKFKTIPVTNPHPDEEASALACINSLQYDQIWKQATDLCTQKPVTLRAFKPYNEYTGVLQLLAATPAGPRTLAQALVHKRLHDDFRTGDAHKFQPNIRTAVITALKKSLKDYNTYKVDLK